MDNFKKVLSNRRKELKLTQKELAEKLNVSDKTISKWETGKGYPDVTLLTTLARLLEIDVTELLSAEDFREKDLNLDEDKSYDYGLINKFKTKGLISIAFFIIAVLICLVVTIIQNDDLQIIVFVVGVIIYLINLAFFINNLLNYRAFYRNKFYTYQYDLIYFRYSIITLISMLLSFLFMPLMNNSLNFDNVGGIVNISSTLIVGAGLFVSSKIVKKANFKIKKDIINKVISIIALIIFLLIITNLIKFVFLPIEYLLLYIVIFRNTYLNDNN